MVRLDVLIGLGNWRWPHVRQRDDWSACRSQYSRLACIGVHGAYRLQGDGGGRFFVCDLSRRGQAGI